jgi:hypothetical protein
LKEHGIEPAPQRQRQTTWKTFLRAHWDVLAAEEPGTQGPRRVSKKELRNAFVKGWEIESIEPSRFEVRPDLKDFAFSEGGLKAWFALMRRTR